MRALLLFLFGTLLVISAPVAAQITTCQVSLVDSTQNILYIGFPNRVVIKGLPTHAQVRFGNKFIIPDGNNYILRPTEPSPSRLTIYDKYNRVLYSKTFVAARLGGISIQVGKVKYQVASVQDVLANPSLVCVCEGCLLKPLFRIMSYEIGLFTNDSFEAKKVAGADLTGVLFDEDIQRKIALMKNGDRIYVENIKALGPDSTMRTLKTISIQIAFDRNDRTGSYASDRELRDEVRVIVEGMRRFNAIKRQYGWQERLEETATDSELVHLTDHESAVVRTYAFRALVAKNRLDLFPVLMKHLHDTASVKTGGADVMVSWPINVYFLLMVWPTGRETGEYRLTKSQEGTIDSILLFDSTIMRGARGIVLQRTRPGPRLYSRIREMAVSGKEHVAVLLLAKYNNSSDVALLKKLLEKDNYYLAYAVREFPHPSFFAMLKKAFEKKWAAQEIHGSLTEWKILFEAMARYPSKETYRLFEKTTSVKDQYQYQELGQYLLTAIHKYPSRIFDPLKKKIKLDESHQVEMQKSIAIESW